MFSVSIDSLSPPPAASYRACAKLALTLAKVAPLVASVQYFARPAPGVAPDAPEAEANLPRQPDVLARQNAIAVTAERPLVALTMTRELIEPSNLAWLSGGFQLVLGAGFFGMYQHAGVMRALAGIGLHSQIRELCGVSSGAITAALYSCLGPNDMTRSVLHLSLLDFLDVSVSKLVYEGALCAGKSVEEKITRDTGQKGCTRIEDAPGPKLKIAVFDGALGKTQWRTEGPLGCTVARSAALPVLFANDGVFDGGWIDHHGYTALRPKERALSVRINTGIEPNLMQTLVGRPTPLFNISEDQEHKTVALKPAHKIDAGTFLLDIDFRKEKLVSIIEESEAMFLWWLHQPADEL